MKIFKLIYLFFFVFPFCINAQSNLQFTSACDSISIEVNVTCDDVEVDLAMPVTTDCSLGPFLIQSYSVDYFSNGFIDEVVTGILNMHAFIVGEHIVTYTVQDQCGTSISCERIVIIYDNTPPTYNCPNPTNMIFLEDNLERTFHANSFNIVFDNCTDNDDLIASFSLDSLQETYTVDCNDLLSAGNYSSIFLTMYATDASGNLDSCTRQVNLIDNFSLCNLLLFDSLLICAKAINGEPIQHFTVNNEQTLNANPCTVFFPVVGFDKIFPDKNSNPRNGVNLLDLILLQKSIAVSSFDEVYEIVAGDLNHSGFISESDVGMLQFFLLRVIDELSSSRSWRFVRDGFVFSNPDTLPNNYHYYPLNILDNDSIHFTAIKSGDINFSADPSEMSNGVEDSIVSELMFCTNDLILEAGEEITTDITAKDFDEILGFQYTLEFDTNALAFQSLEPTNLPNVEYGSFGYTKIQEGLLPMVWIDKSSQGISISDDVSLFKLNFSALSDAILSNVFTISETRIPMDAYGDIGRLTVEFDFCNSVASEELEHSTFRLLENFPNPFNESMEIPFELTENQVVTLTILDIDGRTVKTDVQNFSSGLNSFFIKKNDLPSDGIYFFEVKTIENIGVGKMVLH